MRQLLTALSCVLGLLTTLSNAATCGSYTTSATCATVSSCIWEGTVCKCADLVADFVFLVDASGSIGPTRFVVQKQMITDLVKSSLPKNSGVGIIRFSNTINTILPLIGSNGKRASEATVLSAINNMAYTGGGTHMGTAVRDALTMLGSSNRPNKRIFLVTDGQPNGPIDPCNYKTQITNFAGLHVVILGVGGGFSEAAVVCLVQKEKVPQDWIITISAYDPNLFKSVLPKLDNAFCPKTYNLKVTEVKVEVDSPTAGTHWVEVVNQGSTNALMKDIGMRGLFTGNLATSTSNMVIAPGAIVVVYDATRKDAQGNTIYPSCQDCNCTKVNIPNVSPARNVWCRNVHYVGCSSTSSCVLGPGVATSMRNNIFTVEFYDYTGQALLIDKVQYDPTSGWPVIYTGYTYELKNWLYANNVGVNWQMSCNARGTPGSLPITSCGSTCTPGRCRSGGDMNPHCTSINTCQCHGKYFYPSTNVCLTLLAPKWCVATLVKSPVGVYEVEFTWATVATPTDLIYSGSYKAVGQTRLASYTRSTNYKVVSDYDPASWASSAATFGYVVSQVQRKDVAGATVVYESAQTHCTKATSSPTPSPTKSPTYPVDLQIFLGGDICSQDRCGCYQSSRTCVGPIIEKVLAVNTQQFLTVKRLPLDFGSPVYVYWEIFPIGGTPNATNTTLPPRRMLLQSGALCNASVDICPTSGIVQIDPGQSSGRFNVTIQNNVQPQYNLTILRCTTPVSGCSPVYPRFMTLKLNAAGASTTLTSNQNPVWLWWVIGALILFLFLLAWLVYRYWWKNKATKKELANTQNELDDAIVENELGFAHDLDAGDVVFNPIATGVPGTSNAPDYFSNEMAQRQADAAGQRADVTVEKFAHREQFGQIAPPKNKAGNDLAQPLLGNN